MERIASKFLKIAAIAAIFMGDALCDDISARGVDDGVKFISVGAVMPVDFESLVTSGNGAHKIGLFPLAKRFFGEAFEVKNLSNDQKCMALIGLIESCLATGDFSEASAKFDAILRLISAEIQPKLKSKFVLCAAMVACFRGDFPTASKVLLKSDIKTLDDSELAWYHAIKSVLFAIGGDLGAMADNLEKASKLATSTDQAAQIQAFSVQFMLHAPSHASELEHLLSTVESLHRKYKFQRGYPFAKAHALLLLRTGHNQRAKELLEDQIAGVKDSDVQSLQSLRLYCALAGGLLTPDGLNVAVNLLLSSANDELKKQTLKLLISSAENATQRMEIFRILSRKELQSAPRAIGRQILLAKIRLAIDSNNLEAAQETAEKMILQFPKDVCVGSMYRALAYLALQQSPKDYRMAAHYLGKMRDMATDEREIATVNIQIGNAFYLSGAYDIASHLYEEVLKSNLDGMQYDKILCQLVQAKIKSGGVASAEQHLQNFRRTHDMLTEYRWHAELLYVNALIGAGNPDHAIDYLSALLDTHSQHVQTLYLVKFYLLQAHSMFSKQNYQRAHLVASNICKIFTAKSNSSEIAHMVSQALFIKGTCEFKLKNESDGRATFEQLRADYRDHETAMLSYFEEAEYFHRIGDAEEAQRILFKCAGADCKYSPFAYYRCAEYYKSLGMQHCDAAIAQLSDLVKKYSSHEIVYAARLEIADLLRASGRFSEAQLVYEELLNDFPYDRRSHFTEFCLAKSIFAQKGKGSPFVERAQMILERLYSTVGIDRSLHMEIAAMYCLVFSESGAIGALKNVAWETLLTAVADDGKLSRNDLHWMLQITELLDACYSTDRSGVEFETLCEIADKLKSLRQRT
ncbi:MAG: hypothetical protein LBT64_03545 [Puniceicoccales bacterium]|jgi:tetratricopeptide (TPR) repeat protein|nr:hypothetical protein [Puniceicoccales bacterium]